MISNFRIKFAAALSLVIIVTVSCTSNQGNKKNQETSSKSDSFSITVQAQDYVGSKTNEAVKFSEKNTGFVKVNANGWLEYKVQVPETGRYKIRLSGATSDTSKVVCWIEDNVYNKDGRTYNITGNMMLKKASLVEPIT